MEQIDNSKLNGKYKIQSKFKGVTLDVDCLSTGCKTVLNGLEHGAVYSDYAVMPFDMNGVKVSDEEGTRVITDYEELKAWWNHNITILTGSSATGKTASFSFIKECMAVNPKNLFATSENLFELVSESNGEQTEFRMEHYYIKLRLGGKI